MNSFYFKFLKTVSCLMLGSTAVLAQGVCVDFQLFYADINYPPSGKQTDIYSVSLEGNDAILTPIIEDLNFGAHIAYNNENHLLYLVNDANGSVTTLDPISGVLGSTVSLASALSSVTVATFNDENKLIIGSGTNDRLYQVNFASTPYTVSLFAQNNDISGGDIAFTDTDLLLAAKPNGNLYTVYPGFANPQWGTVEAQVTGMATLEGNESIIVSSLGNTQFKTYSVAPNSIVQNGAYNAVLNGMPFTLGNGDMTSGCTMSITSISGCDDYRTYYIHDAVGGGPDILYEVVLNSMGGAQLTQLATLPSASHLGVGPDGLLYIVRYNTGLLTVWDPVTLSNVYQVQITYNGNNVNNIPALVVDDAGVVYVAGGNNKVFSVDPVSGIATLLENVPVNGGDLVFVGDVLWYANRNQSRFYEIGGPGQFDVDAEEINGVSILPDGNLLIANGNLNSLFEVYVPGTGAATGEVFNTGLQLFNGDLASRCFDENPSIEGCFGFEVLEFNQGPQTNGNPVAADRSNPANALGQPDASNAAGGFVSLGVGGSITIGFAGAVIDGPGADIRVFETSFSGDVCGQGDDESAMIELSQDGFNFVSAGIICRDGEIDMEPLGLEYVTIIRITNAATTSTPDGYDVDGVEAIHGCGSIPEIITGECYAAEMVEYVQGTNSNGGSIALNRTDATQALGEPERVDQLVFVSLGYGGSLTLAFNGAVPNMEGDDLEIVETTYNNNSCGSYPEWADVYVSVDGIDFAFAKTICRADNFVDISDAGSFSYINYVKIVNNNTLSTTPDAFDVDGVVAIHNCIDENEDSEDDGNGGVARNVAESQATFITYPNPTTGPAVIEFSSPTSQRASVEVLDMNGRSVEVLFNQEVQSGETYRVDFNGTALPNGIYIVKFTNGSEMIIDKIMIAR